MRITTQVRTNAPGATRSEKIENFDPEAGHVVLVTWTDDDTGDVLRRQRYSWEPEDHPTISDFVQALKREIAAMNAHLASQPDDEFAEIDLG